MPDRPRTYWILRKDQLRVLASPRRHDILDRLVADGPSSVREFADAIGIRPSAAYYHLEQLLRVGLVVESGSRVVRRRSEKLYAAVAPRMRMARALDEPELRSELKQVVRSLCRQMDRDFSVGIDSDEARSTGSRRNLAFGRLVGAPDAASLAEINAMLDRIAELLWSPPARGKTKLALGWTLAPLPEPPKRRRRG